MASKDSNKHKFGDWLLKQENDAEIPSYKREYIPELNEKFMFKKLKYYFLGLIIINIIILLLFLREMVWIITLVCDFVIAMILILSIPIKYHAEMEEYTHTEFDKKFSKGEYDKIMKKMKGNKPVIKW